MKQTKHRELSVRYAAKAGGKPFESINCSW